jgi:hypothetical protein
MCVCTVCLTLRGDTHGGADPCVRTMCLSLGGETRTIVYIYCISHILYFIFYVCLYGVSDPAGRHARGRGPLCTYYVSVPGRGDTRHSTHIYITDSILYSLYVYVLCVRPCGETHATVHLLVYTPEMPIESCPCRILPLFPTGFWGSLVSKSLTLLFDCSLYILYYLLYTSGSIVYIFYIA